MAKKKTTQLLIVCLTNLTLSSCLHRANSQKMLEVRADYKGTDQMEASALKLGDGSGRQGTSSCVPMRIAPKTANIWIFPHETPAKEYFWGGWISVVVEGDRWELDHPSEILPEKPNTQNQKEGGNTRKELGC